MQRHFDEELDQLKEKLLLMAGHATHAIMNAMTALSERDDTLARKVEKDDTILDQFEKQIDEKAIAILALKAPLASDLRLITTIMKVSRDLERVGDEATTIARRAKELNTEAPLKSQIDLPHMAELVKAMLKGSIDSFVNRDPAKAREIIPRDKQVDALNKEFHREMILTILKDNNAITRCLNLMVISKSLERIADHAANIAEEVVYLYEARDIRHQPAIV